MVGVISMWAFVGTILILINTYKDVRTGYIDDKKNIMMMGSSLMLASVSRQPLWYVIIVIFLALGLKKLLDTKIKDGFGAGDITAIVWMFYGFGIISIGVLSVFLIVFTIFTSITFITIQVWQKFSKKPTTAPFYPTFLLSFVITCIIMGLY